MSQGIGLALSGGGSRAAAFHRGTLKGIREVGLLDAVDTVSTVSGGSLFGAAWMAAIARGESLDTFLNNMRYELSLGFVSRAMGPRLLLTAWPGYTRTNLVASALDRVFFRKLTLGQLPDQPKLCINVTVMNSGQVGKFGKKGFKSVGLVPPGSREFSEWIGLPEFRLALATAASAAFPVGLPPVYLKRGREIPEGWGASAGLEDQRLFALTDGGVLENLGIQNLLNAESEFCTWDIISSDASARDAAWAPGGAKARLRGLLMGALSAPVLERVSVLMNDKEDRHTRHHAVEEERRSRLVEALRSPATAAGAEMRALLGHQPERPRRKLLMVRLSQDWGHFISRIPEWRLKGLAESFQVRTRTLPPPMPHADDLKGKEDFLDAVGLNLSVPKAIYRSLGGDSRVAELNRIGTNLTPILEPDLDSLFDHARWQVHALYQIYWRDTSESEAEAERAEAYAGKEA